MLDFQWNHGQLEWKKAIDYLRTYFSVFRLQILNEIQRIDVKTMF